MYAKSDLSSSKYVARIRDPIRKEDRERIADDIRFRKRMPYSSNFIGGQDRSFDKASDTYGNSFADFADWPEDVPMDAQMSAEYFLYLCFKDTVIRMMGNRVLSEKEAESIIWTASMGMLVSAAATVNYVMNSRKEGQDV